MLYNSITLKTMLTHKLSILALLAASPLLAQSQAPTLHSSADLAKVETKLLAAAKASPTGFGMDTIDDFGSARTLVVVRVHTGEAELHDDWADQMYINKGAVTLVTGGTIKGAYPQPGHPGETRGPSLEGGKEITLHAGDTVHVPAGVTHWVKLAPGTTATYLVFKEKK
jgi:mannose-6-phosphate isomerase-like protein (cupin superfamily)